MKHCLLMYSILMVWGSGFSQSKEDSVMIDEMNNEAWSFIGSDPLKCLELSREAVIIARKKGYSKGEMKAMTTCGSSFYVQGIQDSAAYYYNRALEIAEKVGNTEGQAALHNNLGALYRSNGLYTVALKHLKESLELKKGAQDQCKIASAYINIGNLYVTMEQFSKAIEVYSEAREFVDKGNCATIENLKVGLGVAYYKLDRTKEALRTLEGAYSLRIYPLVLNNRGLCYLKDEDFPKALEHFQKALGLNRDSLNSQSGMLGNYLNIGKVQTKQGNFAQAEKSFAQAWGLIQSGHFPDEKIDYHKNYAELYEKMEKWDNAYRHQTLAEQLADSMRSIELDELQSSYFTYLEVREKERHLESEKEKSEQLSLESKREQMKSNRAIWIAVFIGLFAILLVLFSVRVYKRKKRLVEKNQTIQDYQKQFYESQGRKIRVNTMDSKRQTLDIGSITHIEKEKGEDYVNLYSVDGRRYTNFSSVNELMQNELSLSAFVQISRSVIVNLHYTIGVDEDSVSVETRKFDDKKKKVIVELKTLKLFKKEELKRSFFEQHEKFQAEKA